jgi:hypothetical protein
MHFRWLHHITKAAEDYKSRQESRRSDFHPNANIPSVPEPDTKEYVTINRERIGYRLLFSRAEIVSLQWYQLISRVYA